MHIVKEISRYTSFLDAVPRLMVPGPAPMMLAPGGYSPLGRRSSQPPTRQAISAFFFFTEIYQTSRLLLILKSKTQSNMGPNKKRKLANQPEEINFDPDARQQFLTGFRKRKLQRVKHAQEVAEKRAREERIEYRKRVRSFLVEEW